jgi:hypothetical protein
MIGTSDPGDDAQADDCNVSIPPNQTPRYLPTRTEKAAVQLG